MTDKSHSAIGDQAAVQGAGGSDAARAYREQLAREGVSLVAAQPFGGAPAKAAGSSSVGESRVAERKKVSGRARLVVVGAGSVVGKMVDLSLTGACVLMEDMFASKKTCILECDIFHQGKHYLFSTQAVSIYSVLASGKGFKVGFQFGPRTPAADKTIGMLLA